jgi:hypothetical protein
MWAALLARAQVVDRVVAVVQGQPLLASEVALEADLARLDPSPLPQWRAGRDPESLAVDALVLRLAAADIGLYQPSQEAVVERVGALREALGPQWTVFLARHGLDEDRIGPAVRRRMVVERFLARNLPTDPADAEAWLAEYDLALTALRARGLRIRTIPPRGAP